MINETLCANVNETLPITHDCVSYNHVTRQCVLWDLYIFDIYYSPPAPVNAKDLVLMQQIDRIHLV